MQLDKPSVSVIITCFNQEHLIAETLRSVAVQTLRDLEAIVVDDGSTDNSVAVVNQFIAGDPRFRLLLQENRGVAAARNTGFRAARGQFLQFLDGDDLLDPNKLELQLEQLSRQPDVSVSLCHHRFLNHATGQTSRWSFAPIQPQPLQQLLSGWHAGVSIPVHSPLYRRSIWNENEAPYPDDYRGRCEDWVFLVIVALKGTRFTSLDQELCTYRLGCNGFTATIENSCGAALEAAAYISRMLPAAEQSQFLRSVCDRTLRRYLETKRPEILTGSFHWRLGRTLTAPWRAVTVLVKKISVHVKN